MYIRNDFQVLYFFSQKAYYRFHSSAKCNSSGTATAVNPNKAGLFEGSFFWEQWGVQFKKN